jgi:hypothetical protein
MTDPSANHEKYAADDVKVEFIGGRDFIIRFPLGMDGRDALQIIIQISSILTGSYQLISSQGDKDIYDEFTARRNTKRASYLLKPDVYVTLDDIRKLIVTLIEAIVN